MAGRAGRKGRDTFGESILLIKAREWDATKKLVTGSIPPLESCLCENKRGMIRPLLEVISSGVVETVHDIDDFIKVHTSLIDVTRNHFIVRFIREPYLRPSKSIRKFTG